MTIKELNKLKVPIVRIDPKLNKFEERNLFPDKLDEANRILERVGVPGEKLKKSTSAKKNVLVLNEPTVAYKKKKSKRKA